MVKNNKLAGGKPVGYLQSMMLEQTPHNSQ